MLATTELSTAYAAAQGWSALRLVVLGVFSRTFVSLALLQLLDMAGSL